jgi:hypothetical protein
VSLCGATSIQLSFDDVTGPVIGRIANLRWVGRCQLAACGAVSFIVLATGIPRLQCEPLLLKFHAVIVTRNR